MRVLATAMLAASAVFLTPMAITAASAQTKQGYSATKPREPVRTNENRAGGRYDPDPFIHGEVMRHRNSGWPD